MVFAIAVVVAVLFMVAVGAAYYYKTKKKDKGTKVVPAAKPDKAPGQPATQPATQPAAASATAGAGPAAPYSQLTPETVKALRDAKKALDEGKMSEEDFKTTKAGLLGKETPAAKPTKGKRPKPAATTPTKKKAKTDPFGCPDPVTEAPVRKSKKRGAAATPKKAKKAKTSLVGKAVNKKFKGYRSASGTEYFDGVVKSVEDGMCVIAWEDGEESPMKDTAVQKILV